jgi:ubiquinone biosynthesis protein COQ4
MALSLQQPALGTRLAHKILAASTITASARLFSVLRRPPPNYPGHVPLTSIERTGLAVGSAVMSLLNPRRGGIPVTRIRLVTFFELTLLQI